MEGEAIPIMKADSIIVQPPKLFSRFCRDGIPLNIKIKFANQSGYR